ncbi:radical SAM protein with 4Fe4S-binding SPASM domain [Desulfohalotomaculum tongense]|uniref:PD-(D/E)XK nuclease family protein n=1 Tax=Desulforadius tongensis TaxID=1216062 RepID=UPI00195EFF84|nr:PD-(D/E)XK nuclease family protein [Desulforadius tongensis]MBM7855097.1 radical SAM protein with 4Fe4S-binding SPASM domain [Desulforadius tongensis]
MITCDVKEMYFSQNSFSTYDFCSLKFRRRYIDGLYWPGSWVTDNEKREMVEQGQLFHLLAHRYYCGIAMGELERYLTEPVSSWFKELQNFRPLTAGAVFLPEQELRCHQDGIRLVAKFDLLMVLPDGRAVIYDWKTALGRPKSQYYRQHIQTIVYRYLLVKAGGFLSPRGAFSPADISMIYWNPRYPRLVEPLAYSEDKYQRDADMIEKKIKEIESRDYDQFYATGDQKKCRHCEYSPICHGRPMAADLSEEVEEELDIDWDDIDEMLFE